MSLQDSVITVLNNGKESDITPKELIKVTEFKEAGCPGLSTLVSNEVTLTKAYGLYMDGKTYHEIATITGVKKDVILYVAHKHDWFGTKMEHLAILDANIKDRILQAKLVDQDFVLQIKQFFIKKIGRKMTRFMASGDEETANAVNKSDIELYMKAVDLLDKISTEKVPTNSRPTVGLNLGDGVTVRKIGENEVSITPKQKTHADMLKEFANMKRDEEAKSTNDIKSEDTETNTEQEKEQE